MNNENSQNYSASSQDSATNINITFNQPVVSATTKKINGILYFIMTWFFGWLGVHRFLRGQVGIGILYLFTLGLFGIGAFIDWIFSIIYLFEMDDNQNIYFVNGKYSKINK